MNFPDHCLWCHQETKGGVSHKASSPAIIRSMKSGSGLPKIISKAHSPLITNVHEWIIAVFEVIGISIGLFWLKSFRSSELCLIVIEIVAV